MAPVEVPITHSQLLILLAVGIVFSLGVFVRHVLEGDYNTSKLEVGAVTIGGFFAFGLLFCYPLQQVLKCSNENYFVVAPTIAAIFISGFFARSELLRWRQRSRASAP